MTEQTALRANQALPEVLDDLSSYIICGRVTTCQEPGLTHVASGLDDAAEAERLGLRRIWLSERFDLKDSGAFLAGIAARTWRLGVGTGALAAPSRHPMITASFGATMQALYGDRLTLGLGRGVPLPDMPEYSFADFRDYARTLRALWDGGRASWPPLGDREPAELRTVDTLGDVPRPGLWYCTYGRATAARVCADPAFDGVMLYPFLTADAVRSTVQRIRNACADIGRDPDSLRICHPIVVASELDDTTTRAYAHARAVTYLEWPGHGEALTATNGWDAAVLERLRDHAQLRSQPGVNADQSYHRAELLGPAKLVPDEWMAQSCAIGPAAHCADRLQEYRNAGADEIAIYASPPAENTWVVEEWRARHAS